MSVSVSAPLEFAPGNPRALALQERLGPKLLETSYAQEESLSNFVEFITIMISNAKTKDQINAELAELIGEDFDPAFTDWLFEQVEEIINSDDANHEWQEMQEETNEIQPESISTGPARQRLKEAPTSARSAASPYPRPDRMMDQINKTMERGPIKHSIPDLPNVPTGPRAAAQSSAGPIRRGRGMGRHMGPGAPVPQNIGAFMLSNGIPPDLFQQFIADAATFQQQIAPAFPSRPLNQRISDGSSGIVVASGNNNRCRHWPKCQLGARCKFHHPSQICPAYPNCPYLGGTCPNIHVDEDIPASELQATVAHQLGAGYQPNGEHMQHPKTNGHTPRPEAPRAPETKAPKLKVAKSEETVPLCKFAAGCTKPDCPFAHPTPAAGQEGLVLRGEMCPDGRDCLNRECDMGHPSPAVEGVRRKENEMCKFFPNCNNPECPYKHPAVPVQKALSIPCKFGVNCTRPNCIYNHEIAIQCRYNPCLNEHCLFQHAEGQQPNKNKVWTADGSGSKMERKFAYDNVEERIMVGGGMDDETTAITE